MAEQREWKGIQQNECVFQGKVVDAPVVGDGYAQFTMECITGELADGQWTDVPMLVPMLALHDDKIRTIRDYVMAGRRLLVRAYYKTWEDQGQQHHSFIVSSLKLGSKPREAMEQASGPSVPPMRSR